MNNDNILKMLSIKFRSNASTNQQREKFNNDVSVTALLFIKLEELMGNIIMVKCFY